jgi:uncharacterized protein (DUF2461 family)
MTFAGFPKEALDFYDDLELDNTKSFWTAHKDVYETCVKEPMVELTSALEEEFGPAKIFRPYRDVRFAKDKTPYKNHQGAYVASSSGSGWYVQISSAGVYAAVGNGTELLELLGRLERKGWTRGGETLKTRPQGYAADHPRIELLRHKSLVLHKNYGFDDVIHTPMLLTAIRADWRSARPFVDWVGTHST